jgi:phosphoglucosamine mutase
MTRLFGTDGIRGTAHADLTTDLVGVVGRALARACRDGVLGPQADRPRIVIGRDTRTSGPEFERALVDGLVSAGADALVGGILPTAAVSFLTGSLPADAGVVISASHNPPQDNGIKVFGPGGFKLPVEVERAIEERVGAEHATTGEGERIDLPDAYDSYVAHLVRDIRNDLTGLRVVCDCANGAAYRAAPEALRYLGAEVIELNATDDGSGINEGCGALHPKVVAEAAAREHAIGLSFDGDADRVVVTDEDGRIVDGDGILALLASAMREEGSLDGNGIVVTQMSNQALRSWCEHEAIRLVETGVGDRFVLEGLREHGLVLGGEQSGHIIRLDRAATGDGILIGIEVLDLVAANGGKLCDLVPFDPFPQVLVNVKTSARDQLSGSNGVRSAVLEAERRLGEDGRVLVRPSGTEPLVRVMVEARDAELAGELAHLVADAVRRATGSYERNA